jgi:aldehyde dehydrogenase (NAD+)
MRSVKDLGMADLEIPPARHLIDGEWVPAREKGELPVIDPALNRPFHSVARAGRADIDDAVAAAHRAFPGWAATSPSERGAALRRWADLIALHTEELSPASRRATSENRSRAAA